MNQYHRITIKNVARAAGVSAQTVSRVINDRPDVALETRQRVQRIIRELDYRPSALARSLIQQRSFTLGVITAGLKYIGPSRTLNGITQRAEQLGYSVLLKELPAFTDVPFHLSIQSLLARHVDGLIWAIPEVDDNQSWVADGIQEIPVPTILLTAHTRQKIFSVSYDNYLGGCKAVQHLIDQGYRHIGHVAGPLGWWEAQQRKKGWEDTLKDHGFPINSNQWREGNWSSASGAQALCQLLFAYPEMDAVFVGNDQMALGALKFANQNGLRIPSQLGIIGFDGLPETRFFCPSLSTVFQDQHCLGFSAVEKIVDMIERIRDKEEEIESEAIILQPELIIRDSSIKQNQYQ